MAKWDMTCRYIICFDLTIYKISLFIRPRNRIEYQLLEKRAKERRNLACIPAIRITCKYDRFHIDIDIVICLDRATSDLPYAAHYRRLFCYNKSHTHKYSITLYKHKQNEFVTQAFSHRYRVESNSKAVLLLISSTIADIISPCH